MTTSFLHNHLLKLFFLYSIVCFYTEEHDHNTWRHIVNICVFQITLIWNVHKSFVSFFDFSLFLVMRDINWSWVKKKNCEKWERTTYSVIFMKYLFEYVLYLNDRLDYDGLWQNCLGKNHLFGTEHIETALNLSRMHQIAC